MRASAQQHLENSNPMIGGRLLLQREFFDYRGGDKLVVRLTHPVFVGKTGDVEEWVCYVQIQGLDVDECFPVTATAPFDAIICSAEILHHRLAPIEEHLVLGDRIGSSFFPRIVTILASKAALERIDTVLKEEEPRKLRKIDPDKEL